MVVVCELLDKFVYSKDDDTDVLYQLLIAYLCR